MRKSALRLLRKHVIMLCGLALSLSTPIPACMASDWDIAGVRGFFDAFFTPSIIVANNTPYVAFADNSINRPNSSPPALLTYPLKTLINSWRLSTPLLRILATLTALADRTRLKGKIVDTIDANLTAEGKIFVNKKDVTKMFIPEKRPAKGPNKQPAATEPPPGHAIPEPPQNTKE